MLQAELPSWASVLFTPKRYKVFWGGRGAGRSWSYAAALLIMGGQQKMRILCCREFQKSIMDSVHKLLGDTIERIGLMGWVVQKTSIYHRLTGTEFIFEGLRYNANRIKSLEGIDICWVEEAESVSKESWDILIPTIRKDGSEIWISFNPDLDSDPTYQRFVVNTPDNAHSQKVGWEDNPWFPMELRDEKDYLYRVDPDAAAHVWGGETRSSSEAQVLHGKWRVEAFEPEGHWAGPFYGADYGFAQDPTACLQVFVNKRQGERRGKLMVRRESWRVNLDISKISSTWQSVFGRTITQAIVRADSNRPETTAYLKKRGFRRIQSVFKWPGSVEDGIAYLRQFEDIIIHPSCKHTIQEAKLWSYKVDEKTMEVLPKLIDKHNHCWDAIRYALAPMIRIARRLPHKYSGTSYATHG